MRVVIKKGKWLIGQDSIHLVVNIKGREFYTDVNSVGTNYTLVEDLEIFDIDIEVEELNHEMLKMIEDLKWNNDLDVLNMATGRNYTIKDYKNLIK